MATYYNEKEPFAAYWLRELMTRGAIPDGEIDTRSIVDVRPDDVRGFSQCHFFAGIGGWAYALRLAGWGDDRPVWTGSAPCQPFSDAGKKLGFADERHLWPEFCRLIRECRPEVVFGEQVASKDGIAWIDVVQTDMEDAGYAFAPFDLCAAGVGAYHGRQRLYFVADTQRGVDERRRCELGSAARRAQGTGQERQWLRPEPVDGGDADGVGLADTACGRCQAGDAQLGGLPEPDADGHVGVAQGNPDGEGPQGQPELVGAGGDQRAAGAPGAFDIWRDPEWIYCTDGKYRPTQPGLFPLAHGVPARVGRLRGYGNAIVPQLAATFIEAYREVRGL